MVRSRLRSTQTSIIISRRSTVIVLPRKKGESVVIRDDIILTVIEVREDKVQLGIEQPKGVTVHRREIDEAILSQQEVGQGT
jgi:carbon storage regulator